MTATDTYDGFTAAERAAMKAAATERKNAARRTSKAEKAAAELADCRAKIEEMTGLDRQVAEAVHAIVTEHAPGLAAKTWYGMPAYARDGKAVLYVKPAAKFKVRYTEVGFTDAALLDDGNLWPTAYAVLDMDPKVEQALTALVQRAAG